MTSDEVEEFTLFVEARRASLLRTAYLLTSGDAHAAEDLLQAALLKALRSWGRIRDRDSVERYVRRIMVNERRAWFRRKASGEVVSDLSAPTHRQDADPAGAQALQRVDDGHLLGPALASLTRRQRAVVVLRYADDLPEEEVAWIMGCSVGTVKSQTSKALAKLRLALATTPSREHTR